MLKTPRFVIMSENQKGQIREQENDTIKSQNLNYDTIICVDPFDDETKEKDLVSKICKAINKTEFMIREVQSKDLDLNQYKENNNLKVIIYFSNQFKKTEIENHQSFKLIRTFGLNQLLTDQQSKAELWSYLKKII